MISFACKDIDKEELIRCSFELNKTEYKLLMFLMLKNALLLKIKRIITNE